MTDAQAAKRVVLVAAVAENRVIGSHGTIPWHLPGELKHFKATTTGHVVVMGRATFDSIGRPLPGRTNVVLTRDPHWSADGVVVVHSLAEAMDAAAGHDGDVMVIGGGQVYAEALPTATHQVLTEVRAAPEGDAFYPEHDRSQWRETRRERHPETDPAYEVVWLERRDR